MGVFGHFSLIYHFSFLSPSLWETARYRLKYCLKGPLSPKQPTNQSSYITCGALYHFGMKSPDADPTVNHYTGEIGEKEANFVYARAVVPVIP